MTRARTESCRKRSSVQMMKLASELSRLTPITDGKEAIKGIRWVPQLDGGAALGRRDWTDSERPLLVEGPDSSLAGAGSQLCVCVCVCVHADCSNHA